MRISDWSSDVCSSDLIPVQDLKDQINKNESIKDIDNAFVVTAVDIATQTKWGNQYLYEFFNSLLAIQGVNRTSFEGSVGGRSEERRVGKECVSTCRSRWSRYH